MGNYFQRSIKTVCSRTFFFNILTFVLRDFSIVTKFSLYRIIQVESPFQKPFYSSHYSGMAYFGGGLWGSLGASLSEKKETIFNQDLSGAWSAVSVTCS